MGTADGAAAVERKRAASSASAGPTSLTTKRTRAPCPNNPTSGINVGSLVMLIASALAAGAAIMAQRGFRGRDHTVGIDLGTTYSVVAISQNNNVTVIPDESGFLITPSIVALLPNGHQLVGREARAHRTVDPRHTIFNAKRFIGRSYHEVQASSGSQLSSYDFQVSSITTTSGEDENGSHDNGAVCFAIDLPGHPRCVSPVDVGSRVVRYLKTLATRFVGHNQINKAVIAVPVDFNARQRAATVAAFKAAGLQVTRVLEEPTAAAIAYGLHQKSSVNFILVFDFGGGTLDVSLLFSRSGSISVVDTMGDNNLGGEDIDAVVAEFITQQIQHDGVVVDSAASTVAHPTTKVDSYPDPTELPCSRAGIRRAAELLKRELSAVEEASASCVVASSPTRQRLQVRMTRQQLETLSGPLLQRTLVPVREILAANSMTPADIDAVVLVGGSTRLPWVRKSLAELFEGREPLTDLDPDIAVAYGAARTLD